jgi:radical SAM protein with 4Fe4S-binding SPASM domain
MLKILKEKARHQIRKHPHLRYFVKMMERNFLKNTFGSQYLQNTLKELKSIDISRVPQKQKRPQGSLIEITNACNLNCLMCSTKLSTRPPSLMSPEVFERIIKQLKVTGISNAGLHTVGETFVYKDIETLFDIAEKNDFRVWISTNAQFPERIEPLFRKFPKVLSDIRISIDGATRETFEHIRVGGSFDKVLETLDVIQSINKGKKFFRIGVSIDSVLNMSTIGEVPLFFKTFNKYVFPENINFGVITGLSPDDKYFRSTFPFKNLVRSAVPCHMPFTNQYFTYDGKVTMCCRDYDAEITVGDIMKQTSMEIWDGPESESVRRQHLQPETLEVDACKNCFTPYEFTTLITNNFIHFTRIKLPEISDSDFTNAISALWEGMDEAMKTKDIPKLRNFVAHALNEIDSGRLLPPSKGFSKNNLARETPISN